MARARKSHVGDEEIAKPKRSKQLEEPYSPRVNGHKYVIYCDWHKQGDKHPRVLVLKFLATYAARQLLMKMIGKETYHVERWFDRDDMIVTASGIKMRAYKTQITELLAYEPTEEEAAWSDEQLIGSINRFKYGSNPEDVAANDDDEKGSGDNEPSTDGSLLSGSRLRKSGAKDPKPVRRPKKPKVDKGEYVSANEIAADLKVEGRIVRAVLRSVGLKKPDIGWSWLKASPELADVRKQIEQGLKAEKKKKAKK
jgi:hypothetical protein